MAQYHEEQQRSEAADDIDPEEEARVARDIWEKAVGPQKSNRLVGSGGIGPAPFRTSIIPSLSDSHSGSSTGRNYVPNAAELNDVRQLTQQLSEAQRQIVERQEHYDREMQALRNRMEEETRLAEERMKERMEERFKLLQDQMMAQHSRPSSSASYLPPPHQHYYAPQQYPPQYAPQYAPQYPPQYAPPFQPYQQQHQSPRQTYQQPQHQSPRSTYQQRTTSPPQDIDLNINIASLSALLQDDDAYYNIDHDIDRQPPQ